MEFKDYLWLMDCLRYAEKEGDADLVAFFNDMLEKWRAM